MVFTDVFAAVNQLRVYVCWVIDRKCLAGFRAV
jgi:hypothetical protein